MNWLSNLSAELSLLLVFQISAEKFTNWKVIEVENHTKNQTIRNSFSPKQTSYVIGSFSRASGHLLGAFLILLSKRSLDRPNVFQHFSTSGLGMSRSYR